MLEFLKKYNPVFWVMNDDSEEKEVYEILTEEEYCKRENEKPFSSEEENSETPSPIPEETVNTSDSETSSSEKIVNEYDSVVLDETEGVENIDRAVLEKGLSLCVF